MALTISRTDYEPLGAARPLRGGFSADLVMTMGEFTFDDSYPTGGESLLPDSIGLQDIMFISLTVEASAGGTKNGTILVDYDYNNNKVMAMSAVAATVNTQMANGVDLSAWTVRFVAFGHKLS
jgi:hypothetical protein